MPNRIIKESITTSDTLALVSADAERLFWRLVVLADDYGLYYGQPTTILGKGLTAFLGTIKPKDVSAWLFELEHAGLIHSYSVDGKPYLQLMTWERHQQKRAQKSKYPLPNLTGYPTEVSAKLTSYPSGVSAKDARGVSDSGEQLLAGEVKVNQPPTVATRRELPSSDTHQQAVLASDSVCNQLLANVPVNENVNVIVNGNGNVADKGAIAPVPAPDSVIEVFEYYRAKVQPNARLIDSAKQKIKARLKTFSTAQLKEGIDRFTAEPWRMENNSHEGATWFFHSDDRSEKFLNLVPRPVAPSGQRSARVEPFPSPPLRTVDEIREEWMAPS